MFFLVPAPFCANEHRTFFCQFDLLVINFQNVGCLLVLKINPPQKKKLDAKRVRKTDNIYSSCSMSNHFSRWSSWPRGNHEDAADHVVIWFSASSLAYKIHSSSPNTVCLCSTTSLHCPRWQSLYGWLKWSEAKVSHMFRQLMAPPLKRFSAWNPFSGGKRTHSCIGLLFSDDVAFRGFFFPLVFRV